MYQYVYRARQVQRSTREQIRAVMRAINDDGSKLYRLAGIESGRRMNDKRRRILNLGLAGVGAVFSTRARSASAEPTLPRLGSTAFPPSSADNLIAQTSYAAKDDAELILLGEAASDGPRLNIPPNRSMASGGMEVYWENFGLDYWDKDGTVNGPNHYAYREVRNGAVVDRLPGDWPEVNVTDLVKDLIALGNTGISIHCLQGWHPYQFGAPGFANRTSATPPLLQIKATTGVFSPPCVVACSTSAAAPGLTNNVTPITMSPAFLKFDLSRITGTVLDAKLKLFITSAPPPQTYSIKFNRLRMPRRVWNPAVQLKNHLTDGIARQVARDAQLATHPDVLFYCSIFSNRKTFDAHWTGDYSRAASPFRAEYLFEPRFGTNFIRVFSQYPGDPYKSDGPSILTRRWFLPRVEHGPLFFRYLLRIGPDVRAGMKELGLKLPGPEGIAKAGQGSFSYRMVHLDQSRSNPGFYGFFNHAYDADNPVGEDFAQSRRLSPPICMKEEIWYAIDIEVQMNTQDRSGNWLANGIHRVWVDDVLVYNDTARKIRVNPTVKIDQFFLNLYHGGMGRPAAEFHHDLMGMCVSRRRVGRPKHQS